MTKSEYAKLLLTNEWDLVRRRILSRDEYRCTRCGATNCRLSVHHKLYLENKLPWEVPDRYLEALCDRCHEKAHEGRLISSFIKKALPSNKPPKRTNRKAKKDKKSRPKGTQKVWIAGKGLVDVKKSKR